MFLDDISKLFESDVGFCVCDCEVETLSCRFDEANDVRIRSSLVTNVECFIEIGMVSFEPETHVQVNNVAIFERSLIGDAVADDFVDGGAMRFGEVVVIEW